MFNLALARVYMAGSDRKLMTRNWQDVMDHIVSRRGGDTRRRWRVASEDENFDYIRKLKVVETRPEHFMRVLSDGKPSTNVYLRRLHNYALGMEWLLKSVLPKLLWPRPVYKKKRAIAREEHQAILARETNPDRRDFYDLLWHTGASQGDAASLWAGNINWTQCTISYQRRKLASHENGTLKPALIRFGGEVATLLRRRPASGLLFPYLATVRPGDRATEFKQRCEGLNIHGVSLHSIAEAVSLFRKKPGSDTLEVGFYVFDISSGVPFAERRARYSKVVLDVCRHIQPEPALHVESVAAADAIHEWNLRTGFEGTIYRTRCGGYRPGRDKCLMKRKEKRGAGFTAEREFKPRVDRWNALSQHSI